MRTTFRSSALLLSIVLLAVAAVPTRAVMPEQAILRVQVETRAAVLDGTCVLVHRESRDNDTVLYFLTSSRLLKRTEADQRAGTRRIRIVRDDGLPIEVAPHQVVLPYGSMLDIAIVRVVAPAGTLAPLPMILESPAPGSAFAISGFGADGVRTTISERVGSQATLQLLGNRDASRIAGCAGAPALGDGGVFGLVTECATGRNPVIVPLAAARSFIVRHVPGWRFDSSLTPGFEDVTGRPHTDARPIGG